MIGIRLPEEDMMGPELGGPYPGHGTDRLRGRTAVCFGDSVTWYDGHKYNWGKEAGKPARGFGSYLASLGMRVRNEGISNATILEIRERILDTDLDGADDVLITSGANDSRFNVPTGTLMPEGSAFDLTTFFGCLQSGIEHIRRAAPAARVVLMTPLNGWIYAPGGYEYPRKDPGRVEKRFADALILAGKAYGCPVCDWYGLIRMDVSARPLMINDPEPDPGAAADPNPLYSLHPSTECYRIMAGLLIGTLCRL